MPLALGRHLKDCLLASDQEPEIKPTRQCRATHPDTRGPCNLRRGHVPKGHATRTEDGVLLTWESEPLADHIRALTERK